MTIAVKTCPTLGELNQVEGFRKMGLKQKMASLKGVPETLDNREHNDVLGG